MLQSCFGKEKLKNVFAHFYFVSIKIPGDIYEGLKDVLDTVGSNYGNKYLVCHIWFTLFSNGALGRARIWWPKAAKPW